VLAVTLPGGRRIGISAWLAGAMAFSLSGHASAADPQWLMRPAVALHLFGLMFWIGALPALWVDARDATGLPQSAILTSFSRLVPIAVAAILVSGVVVAGLQLGWPSAAWLSPYGAILGAKLVLVSGLLAIGLWNRRVLTAPSLAGDRTARWRLARSIRVEVVLVLLVLGLVAGWRFTPPPRALALSAAAVVESEPIWLHLMSEEVMAMVSLDPGLAGSNSIGISLSDEEGMPIEAEKVTLTLSSPQHGIEPFRREAEGEGSEWTVPQAVLPLDGSWTMELGVRIGRFRLVQLQTEFDIQ
jgi:copper transport protein